MKPNPFLFLLLIGSLSYGQLQDKIKIPNGVVYNYTDKKIVEKAVQLIEKDLKDPTSFELSNTILIVGPVLWERFQKIKALKNIEGGNTTFLVDNNKLTGKMTQNNEDYKKMWTALRDEIGTNSYSIRKLNEAELRYYWSIISFDIDEPLLIVETKDHKYILNILKDSLKLMWLEEMPRK